VFIYLFQIAEELVEEGVEQEEEELEAGAAVEEGLAEGEEV